MPPIVNVSQNGNDDEIDYQTVCRRADDELKARVAVLVESVNNLVNETRTNVRYLLFTVCIMAAGKEIVSVFFK